jgi:starvation-inducible DNA-binding protein
MTTIDLTEENMSDLGQSLKVVLADTFGMMMNTLQFHWNVEGPFFDQYHRMFGKIYEELFEAADGIAEQIRTLDEYAPCCYTRFGQLATVQEEAKIPTANTMVERLLAANDLVTASLNKALEQAKLANNEAVINFLGDRLQTHAKHGWFLRATTKRNRA